MSARAGQSSGKDGQPSVTLEDIDRDLVDYLQTLSPAERVTRHEQARELVHALRNAGANHYGFDPRAITDPDYERR